MVGPTWLQWLTMCMAVTWALLACTSRVAGRRKEPPDLTSSSRLGVTRGSAEPAPASPRRPLEDLVRDLRRSSRRLRHPPPGTSYVKVQAARYAYDRALAEAGDALGIDHLMRVLEPGPELDGERERLEARLWLAGVRIDEPD